MSVHQVSIIEYIVLLVSEFSEKFRISESEAYSYLNQYGAISLCERHYGIMHTLSVEENIESLYHYCRRKGGGL